jgi:hypothetical protein
LIRIQREKAESDSFYFDLAVVLGLLSESSIGGAISQCFYGF